MATARFKNAEGTVMIMDCPLWERESELGRAYRGRIEIDSVKKRLRAYDDSTYSQVIFPVTFPIQDVVLFGPDVHIKINPVRSTNNNHRMGKITISYTGVVHFTFILSMEDCRTVIGIVSAW